MKNYVVRYRVKYIIDAIDPLVAIWDLFDVNVTSDTPLSARHLASRHLARFYDDYCLMFVKVFEKDQPGK